MNQVSSFFDIRGIIQALATQPDHGADQAAAEAAREEAIKPATDDLAAVSSRIDDLGRMIDQLEQADPETRKAFLDQEAPNLAQHVSDVADVANDLNSHIAQATPHLLTAASAALGERSGAGVAVFGANIATVQQFRNSQRALHDKLALLQAKADALTNPAPSAEVRTEAS